MKISIKREQNDACIGSAEREKFGTMFKKTFRFLSMAALLVVGAIMTGCSSDDNIDTPQQPANKDNVVTLTATVGFEANAGTRAVDPSTGKKTFESGNQIAVIYKNTSNQAVKAVSTDFTPTGDNTKATFTVTLTNPASDGAIRYIYPATMAKTPATTATITDDAATIDYSGLLSSQDGTLATLGTNYDLAVFDGALSGTNLPASSILTNPLAICKFSLTDGTNPVSVNSLTISDGTNAYTVKPTSALSEVYVAMKPVTGANISFTATISTDTYSKAVSGKTLEASKLYPITVPMATKTTPLTVEAITAGTIIVNSPKSGMQYSLNGGDKTAVPDGTDIDVEAGDKVAFYGDGTNINDYDGTCITGGTADIKVYGNIMSLVDEVGFATNTTLTVEYTFNNLFNGNAKLTDASGLLLPAMTLTDFCYSNMFSWCKALTTAPKLPATALASSCYYQMFSNCEALTTAPKLPATTLVSSCYNKMFSYCFSLTTAYVKAAYSNSECNKMFRGCTAAGAVLHTTTANKDSWDGAFSSEGWSSWTAVGDWND